MNFRADFAKTFADFHKAISTEQNEWIIKGFIDVYRNIYPMTSDTKVVSKIIELMLFPVISRFAQEHGYILHLSDHQNHYPDLSLQHIQNGQLIALALKSSYRIDAHRINGMTLGAFTGYFRKRDSTKNIKFPYAQYSAHYVLGVIYTRNLETTENAIYQLDDLSSLESVVSDFQFILQEKWRIASDKPGSGNTKNIGSVKTINRLVNGTGLFAQLGQDVFDDYWMNYLTADMAKAIDGAIHYKNIEEYLHWRNKQIDLSQVNLGEIKRIREEEIDYTSEQK